MHSYTLAPTAPPSAARVGIRAPPHPALAPRVGSLRPPPLSLLDIAGLGPAPQLLPTQTSGSAFSFSRSRAINSYPWVGWADYLFPTNLPGGAPLSQVVG